MLKQEKKAKGMTAKKGACAAVAFAMLTSSAAVAAAPVMDIEEAHAATTVSDVSGNNLSANVTFTFTDSAVTASATADSFSIDGTELTISKPGTYKLTGSCAKGSVNVKKDTSDVTLILDGLTLSNDGDKAIKFKKGASGSIVLKGTNTLSTSNDKGIIKANAAADDNDNITYASDGTTTGGDLVVYGDGTLNLSSSYTDTVEGEQVGCDGFNCEGDLTVLSGTFNIDVTDDGMHADNTLTVGNGSTNPVINITKAEEGLEGASVHLKSGTGDIHTNDDGINAANKDLVSYNWQYTIEISGGTWRVVAAGDGLDSNGNLYIKGGETEAYCTGNGNGAVDYGEGAEGEIKGSFETIGGTLFAVGSDMLVTPQKGNYVVFGGQGGQQPGGQQPNGQQPNMQAVPELPVNGNFNAQLPAQAAETSNYGAGESQQPPTGAAPQAGQQPQGRQPGNSNDKLVIGGEVTSISDASGTVIFSTKALADGSYALFASPDVQADAEYTLASGTVTTSVNNDGQADLLAGDEGQDITVPAATETATEAVPVTTPVSVSDSAIAKTGDWLSNLLASSGMVAAFLGFAMWLVRKRRS